MVESISTSFGGTFKQKFEDQLTCSVCLDQYTNPKTLPCHHSFCLGCIKRVPVIIKSVEEEDGKTVSIKYICCPTCRYEVLQENIACLPSAFNINQLLELQKELVTQTRPKTLSCTEHNDPLKVYCYTCRKVICRDCTISKEHKTHEFELISECYSKHHRQIETDLKLMKEKLGGISRAMSILGSRGREITNHGMKIKKDIHEHAQQLIELVQNSEKQLVQQVNDTVQQKVQFLTRQRIEAERVHGQLKSCEKMIEQNLQELSRNEDMMKKQEMVDGMKIASECAESALFQPLEMANMQFTKSSAISKGIGEVKSSRYGKATLQTTPCMQGEVSKATLILQSHDGTPFHLSPSLISCEIISPENSLPEKCKVTEKQKKGEYEVKFTSHCEGKLQLVAKVGGVEIPGNPFSINVIPEMKTSTIPRKSPFTAAHQRPLSTHQLQLVNGPPRALTSMHTTGNSMVRGSPRGLTSMHAIGRTGRQSVLKPVKTISLRHGHRHIAVRHDGYIQAIDALNHRISVFNREGMLVTSLCTQGMEEGQLTDPYGVAMHSPGLILVTDLHRLQMLTIYGVSVSAIGNSRSGSGQWRFDEPMGIAVDSARGLIFVADFCNHRVQVLDNNLKYIRSISEGEHFQLEAPHDVAVDSDGYLYVAEYVNRITKLTSTGKYIARFGSHGSAPGQLNSPKSIAIKNNLIFVCEDENNRVSIFNTNGKFIECFGRRGSGEGEFSNPLGVAISEKFDELYISDFNNKRIVVYSVNN